LSSSTAFTHLNYTIFGNTYFRTTSLQVQHRSFLKFDGLSSGGYYVGTMTISQAAIIKARCAWFWLFTEGERS